MYILLWEALKSGDLDGEYLRRWLISYFCFYHVGTASWITDGNVGYWDRFMTAAGSKEWPRCPERRHFRGTNALRSVEYLRGRGLEALFSPFDRGKDRTWPVAQVIDVVRQWVGFGPWIAFKAADMLERLGLLSIHFDLATAMYDSPQEGARLLWELDGPESVAGVNDVGAWAVSQILSHLSVPPASDLGPGRVVTHPAGDRVSHGIVVPSLPGPPVYPLAPPRYERPINVQEVETILCKWKSYMGGHYHVGEDVASCRRGLLRFPRCRVAQHLLRGGKAGELW